MTTAGVAGLRRFLTARASEPDPERCDLCAAAIPDGHPHLVRPGERSLRCACRPCALLFSGDRAGADGAFVAGYRTVPDRYRRDPGFTLTDAAWDALRIPVSTAFFLVDSTRDGVLACYPSPAGATESELDLAHFGEGVGASRLAALLEPDVEALLVRRPRGERTECFLVPVDACYRLVGLVRSTWKGFDGGAAAWAAIDGFFDDVRARARDLEGAP
ncbi:DUF5947 family protein [Actinomycetospora sp. TBRC 11914]|uniref:DUF5947 family protein n=1 Tax=Actinomycetospora sp. TBRC 11914 TaxID=2729387 RepID=UPI00145F6559|nr:DUF5947 family protein [Actinomycetospora sp. TBRC 11914]NMO91317.1 hypothetical protein [Actinomycetospora sp. TBRC 11914]